MSLSSSKINANLILWIIGALAFYIFVYYLLFFLSDSFLFFVVNDISDVVMVTVLTLLYTSTTDSYNLKVNEKIKDDTLFSRNHSQYDDISLVILKWHKKNNIVSLGEAPSLDGMELKNDRIQHIN